VRCVVLAAAGRMFSAGADVKELSERTTETALSRSMVSRGCFDAIRRCPVPVVAAVNGHAIGAGAVVASCCDIIVASEDATFSLPEILVGVMGGTRHMARVLPEKMVRYLAMTGRRVDARTVERFGGIQAVVELGKLRDTALDLAKEIATRSPSTVRLMKEAINLTEDMPLNEGYRIEQLFTTIASSMPDSKEAALAFIEKRPPVWTAR
jgi:enoyl-CoA hydratase